MLTFTMLGQSQYNFCHNETGYNNKFFKLYLAETFNFQLDRELNAQFQ